MSQDAGPIPYERLDPAAQPTIDDTRRNRKAMYIRALWSGAPARATNILVQVLILALTVRYLGKERYGMWVTISTLAGWLLLGNFGLGNGLTTSLARAHGKGDRAAADRAVSSTFAMVAISSGILLLIALIVIFTVPWPRVFNVVSPLAVSEARPTVLVAVTLVLSLLPANLGSSVLMGYQRTDLVNISTMLASWLGLGVLFVATRLHCGMPTLAAIFLLPQVCGGISQFIIARRLGLVRLRFADVHLRESLSQLRLGLQFMIIQLMAATVFETGALIIANRFGSAEVTPYGVTNRMVMVILTFFNVLFTPLWPAYGEAFARHDLNWVSRIFWRSIKIVIAFWLPIALIAGFSGRYVIRIWAGPSSVPDPHLLWAMIAFTLAQALGLCVAMPLNGMGKLSSQILGAGLMAALHVPLALWLCSTKLHVAGVAISQASLMFLIAIPLAFAHVLHLIRTPATAAASFNSTQPTQGE